MGNAIKKFCDYIFGRSYSGHRSSLTENLISDFPSNNNTVKRFPVNKNLYSKASLIQTNVTLQNFRILRTLGKGSFGKVLLVINKDSGVYYAMKVLSKDLIKRQNQVTHTKAEREILEKINHPFVVKLKYAFQNPEKLFLVTEYMAGGELYYHMRKEGSFNEARARFYACEITLALEHLHSQNIIYRDLKPENILLDEEGHIKLTDFGLSKILCNSRKQSSDSMSSSEEQTSKTYTICGTPEYLAPEIIQGKGYNHSVDWWSLGVVLYEMLVGWSPFKENKHKLDITVYSKPIPVHRKISQTAMDFIKKLLNLDPTKRLGSNDEDISDIKDHPFFKGVNWDNFAHKNVQAPYRPIIRNKEDVSNFDRVFTEEEPDMPSYTRSSLFPDPNTKDNRYDNFSYVNLKIED